MQRALIALALLAALPAALPVAAQVGEPLSREFKLPLVHAPFAKGGIDEAASAYATSFAALVQKIQGVQIKGTAEFDKAREVRFLDTPGSCVLRGGGYILRERVFRQDYRLTLKTRSTDEAWVRATRIDAPEAAAKLEEDVVPPADGKLSRSATLRLVPRQAPKTLAQAADLFPALKAVADKDAPLQVVEGLNVKEVVYKLPDWKVGSTKFEAGLAVWNDSKDGRLLFVEADFSYDVPQDPAMAREVADKAQALFAAMQADAAWAGARSQSKTEFTYSAAGGRFCQ
jgi:hypothetical protein